jgi:hypothetical protein
VAAIVAAAAWRHQIQQKRQQASAASISSGVSGRKSSLAAGLAAIGEERQRESYHQKKWRHRNGGGWRQNRGVAARGGISSINGNMPAAGAMAAK